MKRVRADLWCVPPIFMLCLGLMSRWLMYPFSKVSKSQYDKVWGFIEAGKREGAKVVLGGQRRTGKGFFVDPTSAFFWRPERADSVCHSFQPQSLLMSGPT